MIRPGKELSESEKSHVEEQLQYVRSLVRHCSDERLPQGPCKFCLEIYRAAMNAAIDLGLWD